MILVNYVEPERGINESNLQGYDANRKRDKPTKSKQFR